MFSRLNERSLLKDLPYRPVCVYITGDNCITNKMNMLICIFLLICILHTHSLTQARRLFSKKKVLIYMSRSRRTLIHKPDNEAFCRSVKQEILKTFFCCSSESERVILSKILRYFGTMEIAVGLGHEPKIFEVVF